MLEAIAEAAPKDLRQLVSIKGFGKAKLEQYGDAVVSICSGHAPSSQQSVSSLFGGNSGARDNSGAPSAKRQRVPELGAAAKIDLATGAAAQQQRISSASAGAASGGGEIAATDLGAEQAAAAARAIQSGENLFITGAAGCGKSYLMRYIIQEVKKLRGERAVAVTAPTGIAAVNIGGVTIHSFAGIGLGRGDPQKILGRVLGSAKASTNWTSSQVLVLDEVSMLSSVRKKMNFALKTRSFVLKTRNFVSEMRNCALKS